MKTFLRLWSAKSPLHFDLKMFNTGDYIQVGFYQLLVSVPVLAGNFSYLYWYLINIGTENYNVPVRLAI
jgi:hypothetical protein